MSEIDRHIEQSAAEAVTEAPPPAAPLPMPKQRLEHGDGVLWRLLQWRPTSLPDRAGG